MIDFTDQEKRLIVQSLDRLFQEGPVTGDLGAIETVVVLARRIQTKIANDEPEQKKPPEGG